MVGHAGVRNAGEIQFLTQQAGVRQILTMNHRDFVKGHFIRRAHNLADDHPDLFARVGSDHHREGIGRGALTQGIRDLTGRSGSGMQFLQQTEDRQVCGWITGYAQYDLTLAPFKQFLRQPKLTFGEAPGKVVDDGRFRVRLVWRD